MAITIQSKDFIGMEKKSNENTLHISVQSETGKCKSN